MARPEKVAAVEEVRAKLADSDAAVLTEYRGLTVTQLAELRTALRPAGAEYKVFKNTLARRAAEEVGLSELAELLVGPTAFTFIKGDAVVAAKTLRDYSRDNPELVIKGGLLGARVMKSHEVIELADIQPREVLLARLAGGFQAPLVKAAGLFQAFTRNMAYGVKALIDQRVAAGEAMPSEPEAPVPAEPAAEPAAEVATEVVAEVEPEAAVAQPEPAAEIAAEITETETETETQQDTQESE